MKKGDVIRQKCVNTTFYLTGILAHKVNNIYNIRVSGSEARLQTRTTGHTILYIARLQT